MTTLESNHEHLFAIDALTIRNYRNQFDYALLIHPFWKGIKQGADGYPI